MKVTVLTADLEGVASHHLQQLLKHPEIEVTVVIYSKGIIKNRKRFLMRKVKKAIKIGFWGTLNGIRMRAWYREGTKAFLNIENLETLCDKHRIPFYTVQEINAAQTVSILKDSQAELGLSLGNGYISSKVFLTPKFGMINIHHEQLPDYQNAQSVIWQLYNGSTVTGYTIHQITKNIDEGEILYEEVVPILFRDSLGETVSATYAALYNASAAGLVKVLKDFYHYFDNAEPQGVGKKYTTPGLFQFLRVQSNFNKLKSKERSKGER